MTSDKPFFLYIPGLDGTGRLIEWQRPLYEHYEVVACGYPQDRSTTYEELADAAAERLMAASKGKPAVVLAESFGGGVAIQFTLRHPELVERLILVNTFARFPNRFHVRFMALLSHVFFPHPASPLTKRLRGQALFPEDLPQSEREGFWEVLKTVPASAMGRRVRMIAGLDLRSRLSEIQVPTLVMVSPDDKVVPPKASRELVASLPQARLLEIPVGHATLIHPRINVFEWLNDSRNWNAESQTNPR